MKRVKDVMSLDVHPADPNETVAEAAARMRAWDVGFTPVCQDDVVVGILTDRDITVRVTAVGRDPGSIEVRDVMTWGAVCVSEERDLRDVATLMKTRQIRRLPVVNREGLLVGLVSLSMLAKAEHERLAGEVLREVVRREP
jgi:CBS domain-containing protein